MKLLNAFNAFFIFFFNISHLLKLSKKAPIIICGCGRSGTTLLLSILGAHSKIQAIPVETAVFLRNDLKSFSRIKILLHLSKYLSKNKKNKAHRWLEKTPLNIHYVPEIIDYFNGKVKIINVVRDGRDVVTSVHPKHKKKYFISISRWINEVQLGLDNEKYDQFLTVKYEDLILNFKKTLINILDFLEEDYDSKLEEYQEYTNVKENVAWNHKAIPLHSKSMKKWKLKKHYKKMIEFNKNKLAKKLLQLYDYEYF